MPAVVRVKRRIDEEPLSAFVLNGKRRRLHDEGEMASPIATKDELSTLLTFAGTIKEQDDTKTTQVARLTKDEAKELILQKCLKPNNLAEKARQEMRQHQQEQRFRVVNCLRTTLEEDNNSNQKSKEITIVDIEKHSTNGIKTEDNSNSPLASSTSNGMITNLSEPSTSTAAAAANAAAALTMPTDSDTGYVYDLYIPENEQQADYVDQMDDNYLSVRPFDDLVYEDCYNDEENMTDYDSEDSNQENYFLNDYPDEEDDIIDRQSDDEDIGNLRKGLNKFVFDNDDDEENDSEFYDDSSSDDNRDPYIQCIDLEQEEDFCHDVDAFGVSVLKSFNTKTEDSDTDDISFVGTDDISFVDTDENSD